MPRLDLPNKALQVLLDAETISLTLRGPQSYGFRPHSTDLAPREVGDRLCAANPIERVPSGNSNLIAASTWGPTPMSLRHNCLIVILKHVMGLLQVLMVGNTCALMMITAPLFRLRLQERQFS